MLVSDQAHNLSFNSDHTFSNHTYKSSSNKHLLADHPMPGCSFCKTKPLILTQLQALRAAIEAKN